MKKCYIVTDEDECRRIKATSMRIDVAGKKRQLWLNEEANDVQPWYGWVRMCGQFQNVMLIDIPYGESVWKLGSTIAVAFKEKSPVEEA